MKHTFIASASELRQSSPLYLSIHIPMFTADKENLNKCTLTSAFIDNIVENADEYEGIPLVADVRNLISGEQRLTHLLDKNTNEYKTTPIGVFKSFEKAEVNGETVLFGNARVWKRNAAVCKACID